MELGTRRFIKKINGPVFTKRCEEYQDMKLQINREREPNPYRGNKSNLEGKT